MSHLQCRMYCHVDSSGSGTEIVYAPGSNYRWRVRARSSSHGSHKERRNYLRCHKSELRSESFQVPLMVLGLFPGNKGIRSGLPSRAHRKNESEKMKATMKFSVVLLALLLAGMAMVPCVSAADSFGETSSSQVELINQLMHQKITIGQYYEKVSPDVLKNMPETLKDRLYKTEMEWPKALNAEYPASTGQKSADKMSATVDIMALSESGYGAVGRTVSFMSRTFTSPSGTLFPYMHDNSKLLKWNYNTNQWDYVTSRDHSSYVASYNAASGITIVQPGTYTVFGQHDGLFPLLEPYVQYTQSPIFYVS